MSELDAQREQRIQKLTALREKGHDPYAARFTRTHTAREVASGHEALEQSAENVSLAGRIVALRPHGKTTFAHLLDGSGRIQVYLRQDLLGEEAFSTFNHLLDLGDVIGVQGTVFRTRTGEVTVSVESYSLLTKSLRPLPEKWHGLKDLETRCRQRYADLMMNTWVRDLFAARSRIIAILRQVLDERGFLEVETPVLQPQYGGAFARPFTTDHQALGMTLYLRIADELYLKRLIIGGMERVYEIAKDFRNEGIDRLHSPEFTMLELYQAYADYQDMMSLVETIFTATANEIKGGPRFTHQGEELDVTPPWKRLSILDAIQQATGLDVRATDTPGLVQFCQSRGLKAADQHSRGALIDEIFSELVQPSIRQPTFVIDYPYEMSPLARRKKEDPALVERFEPIICGVELGNAFSELTDPLDQKARFQDQAQLRQQGFAEAQPLDEDFLRALEYGMPPTGGLGLGVDRMVMLFTDMHNIRDVILFPLMRPER
jgi:lysyl-tRNA synthetase class 2